MMVYTLPCRPYRAGKSIAIITWKSGPNQSWRSRLNKKAHLTRCLDKEVSEQQDLHHDGVARLAPGSFFHEQKAVLGPTQYAEQTESHETSVCCLLIADQQSLASKTESCRRPQVTLFFAWLHVPSCQRGTRVPFAHLISASSEPCRQRTGLVWFLKNGLLWPLSSAQLSYIGLRPTPTW